MPKRDSHPKLAELRELPIVSGVDDRRLRTMTANLDTMTVPDGAVVMTAGRRNDAFWIILDGRVQITIGGRIREGRGRGDVVGLPSMFARRESTADVVALVASHQHFNTLVAGHDVAIPFKAAIFDRLRDEVHQLVQGSEQGR
ncbi:MAG: cyclic nucleotide-binding domain-containing protein [Candidatus Dormibacteraeota bacterium]|uniref:Cyclic nucleotide-binding domain-containing protein n=1 Tax=Candidatus Dormiibacter inghamiae TaxID=3127013 RepID=A0A934NI67_9BACT|nr:cyclic nucleotide-binding domain-containing protein [Candidatus Dormibacteraeota bacterium]MBJ7606154.1 cyclic nucleotide-binding domain-containing protein [Candidatus Dormibacteraeota bacterium]